jgi:N-acetylneuraminate synthase/sialic acid synthase
VREIVLDGVRVHDGGPAFVVAEVGHSHCGDVERALKMITAAQASGASAVKFQTRHPREVYSPALYDKPFDSPHAFGPTVGTHREAIEFTPDEWAHIAEFCREAGITWFSTPFDFKSVDLLESLNCPIYKVASGDATNTPLIEYIARLGKPMIVSTGYCDLSDCSRIVWTVGNKAPLALLHCTCVYPGTFGSLNLRAILTMREAFSETVIGLSHHCPEWTPNVAAFALGARIFEQHFTLDRTAKGTDHAFSLTPPMLKDCVDTLWSIDKTLGNGMKLKQAVEIVPGTERQKALRWARDLPHGHIVTREDVTIQCPGPEAGSDGLLPYWLESLIGTHIAGNVVAGDLVKMQWSAVVTTSSNQTTSSFWYEDGGRLHNVR